MLSVQSQLKLTLVNSRLQKLVEQLHEEALLEGLNVQVACGWRSASAQAALYASGRTAPGPIKTTAKVSRHQSGMAVDLFFLVEGKADWGIGKFQKLGVIAKRLGLDWSGDWKRFKEYCHFELKE